MYVTRMCHLYAQAGSAGTSKAQASLETTLALFLRHHGRDARVSGSYDFDFENRGETFENRG